MRFAMIVLLGALIVVCASSCTVHPKRVDCEGHLQPINAPAPVVKPHERAP